MKKVTYLVIISFLTVGIISSFLSYEKLYSGFGQSDIGENKTQTSTPLPNALSTADWAVYEFDTLVNKVDSIVFADVFKSENKKDENGPPAILSTLKVTEVLHGSASDTIILDQTNNIVEPGKSYLLFLNKIGDYYYELSEESVVIGDKDEFKVQIEGIEGVYKKQDLILKFKTEITTSLSKSK